MVNHRKELMFNLLNIEITFQILSIYKYFNKNSQLFNDILYEIKNQLVNYYDLNGMSVQSLEISYSRKYNK